MLPKRSEVVLPRRNQDALEKRARARLETMTLVEKIGQLSQRPFQGGVVTGHAVDTRNTLASVKAGKVGSILGVHNLETLQQLQKAAVEESRLGMPLLFCYDVIHGYRTAFPINLAQACSWHPDLVQRVAQAVADETSHAGLHLTFSPMVDLVRDPRWGRVMESNGEDPYLSSELAKAYVRGYQKEHLAEPGAIAACVKHFAAYGAAEAGRDYNTVDVSERVLQTMYLPPFQAAIDAGVSMVMAGFNMIFDRPCTANRTLLKTILRDQMGFVGVTISDHTSTEEIINHKVAKDQADAALQCFTAGLDHEMVSNTYHDHLANHVNQGTLEEGAIDEAVMRMLVLKDQLGLFDDPYRNFYEDYEQYMLKDETLKLAQEAVEQSAVLLKNTGILPIKADESIIIIGPFADSTDVIGEWAGLTRKEEVRTVLAALKQDHRDVTYIDDADTFDAHTIEQIESADKVILCLGEAGDEAGEGNSKQNLHLPAAQQRLFDRLRTLNDAIILIVFAGRPLIMTHYDRHAKALLYAWQSGTMTGPALSRLLRGVVSPSGRLAMTFPRHEGQIPLYYNHYQTGRPIDFKRPDYRYNTRYRDGVNEPLYPFGHGLGYAKIRYGTPMLNRQQLFAEDTVEVKVELFNESMVSADEIVQCYIEAETYSVSRPVNELKAFKRVLMGPLQRLVVTFELSMDAFRAYNIDMRFTAEKAPYKIKVGPSSAALKTQRIEINDR